MLDIREIQIQLNKALAQRYGLELDFCDEGYSIEHLYEIAGKEDRVVTLSFREGSSSAQIWGDSLTCCFLFTERERINIASSIQAGGCNYGKIRAKYLLFELQEDKIEKLKKEGFDSKDVVDILVAPQLYSCSIYKADTQRILNQIEIPLDPQPPLDELKFELGVLCHFNRDGMILTPSENIDFIALRLLFGGQLSEDEKKLVFDEDGKIHNNEISRRYLFFKSRLSDLSKEKKVLQIELETLRTVERMSFLDEQLKGMGSSLEKLKAENEDVYNHITYKVQFFNERRINSVGRYPIFLEFKGYIHIGLRHFVEWRFSDYYADRDVFLYKEKDVIPVLQRVVDEINEDYQAKKAERPDYQYRKFGKNSLYFNGDYYMIHIAADGRIENFSKTVDQVEKIESCSEQS